MKNIKIFSFILLLALGTSCKKYLDFVPDNIATIDHAFAMRTTAERYLFTCYSFMPQHGSVHSNPAFMGGDELMVPDEQQGVQVIAHEFIAKGGQNVVNTYLDYWAGGGVRSLYQGINTCNIFLENIGRVPDISETERRQWIAEVKFLKAYYHYWLFRSYGPIPLLKENIPVNAEAGGFSMKRAPVDECVSYIVQLLNEAAPDLQEILNSPSTDLGRITKPIALSLKAEVLVTAASPLFNGNPDYAGFRDKEGQLLFNPTYSAVKWDSAVVACKKAIDLCETVGIRLNKFTDQSASFPFTLPSELQTQMALRNSVAERWNPEIIWANTQSWTTGNEGLQASSQARIDPDRLNNFSFRGYIAPTLKMAELFYSKNGVPIEEDKTYDFGARYTPRRAVASERYLIRENYTTAGLHFDREPRFYSSLAFDGGVWFGQGRLDAGNAANLFYVQAKQFQPAGGSSNERYSGTGYWPKKLVNFRNVIGASNTYEAEGYPWPVLRLADLYLLYAEAQNELNGPNAEAYNYLNLVRQRAGLPTVQDAWTNFSNTPNKYTTKEGLRSIIKQERLIELAFEAKRFWDIRRWKDAPRLMNQPIQGWDIAQEETALYYRVKTLYNQSFQQKDYFWPIRESELIRNRSIVQNLGW